MAELGARVIRDHMPEQHRELFTKLPMLVIGATDPSGRPWATLLTGSPGFIRSPDPYHLEVTASPLPSDPVIRHLGIGADIGVLGLEPETRRRNRMNAVVIDAEAGRLTMKVKQSFGNCPQYIQKRRHRHLGKMGGQVAVRSLQQFDAASIGLLQSTDSFFICSLFDDGGDQPNRGVDVSHRGGLPGFIRVDDDRTLTFPDYAGNRFFSTLGNILLNPLTGLLVIDYTGGSLLYLTGSTEILWDTPERERFSGAERLLRFRLEEALLVSHALPLRWEFIEYSPQLVNSVRNNQT
ncbi:MAG: pyridoxamine 5'-phosphate oxidase family protein [Pseudomonadales bacterium]|nr:pyridoxamine 5'-phosphate oxidase family protein [Pseudomonadales bacterium]